MENTKKEKGLKNILKKSEWAMETVRSEHVRTKKLLDEARKEVSKVKEHIQNAERKTRNSLQKHSKISITHLQMQQHFLLTQQTELTNVLEKEKKIEKLNDSVINELQKQQLYIRSLKKLQRERALHETAVEEHRQQFELDDLWLQHRGNSHES